MILNKTKGLPYCRRILRSGIRWRCLPSEKFLSVLVFFCFERKLKLEFIQLIDALRNNKEAMDKLLVAGIDGGDCNLIAKIIENGGRIKDPNDIISFCNCYASNIIFQFIIEKAGGYKLINKIKWEGFVLDDKVKFKILLENGLIVVPCMTLECSLFYKRFIHDKNKK